MWTHRSEVERETSDAKTLADYGISDGRRTASRAGPQVPAEQFEEALARKCLLI